MTGVCKAVTFFVLVFATTLVFAEDYDVGDDTEWTLPTVMEFYNTWASGKTFRVGDELEFEFAAGRHDVAIVTQEAYENCDKTKPLSLFKTSPVKIMLNTTGPQYYICTIAEHCRFGQKLAIEVVGAGGAGGGAGGAGGATPGAPGAGGAAPTTPGTTPTTPAAGGATPTSPAAGGATPTTPAGTTPTTPSGTTATPSGGNIASSLSGATYLAAFVSAVVALF